MKSVIDIVRDNLKFYRKRDKLTQRQIALHLGITHQSYSHYEKGDREISLKYLNKLSNLYKINPTQFFIDRDNIRNGEFSLLYLLLDQILYYSLKIEKLEKSLIDDNVYKVVANEIEEELEEQKSLQEQYSEIEKPDLNIDFDFEIEIRLDSYKRQYYSYLSSLEKLLEDIDIKGNLKAIKNKNNQ